MKRVTGVALFCAGMAAMFFFLVAVQGASAVSSSYTPYRGLKVFAHTITLIENNYVDAIDSTKLIQGAIDGMFASLDPHSAFMAPGDYQQMKADTQGEFGGLGIEVEIRDNMLTVVAPIEDTPAARADLRSGDQIVKVDGIATDGLRIDEAVRKMRGPRGTRVTLQIRRPGKADLLTIEIVRDIIQIASVNATALSGGMGYIRIKAFQERTDVQVKKALDEFAAKGPIRGLVLDLRNDPGGLLDQAVAVADLFLEKGLIVRTIGRGGKVVDESVATGPGTYSGFPMVCLVNGGSASASEIVAGALQDHRRAVILGTTTFGKGSVQSILELQDGSAIKLTVARYYTPSGRSIQEAGITPDLVVAANAPEVVPESAPKEIDLKGHLLNPTRNGSTDTSTTAAASPIEKNDFQLKTALDHLRAIAILTPPR